MGAWVLTALGYLVFTCTRSVFFTLILGLGLERPHVNVLAQSDCLNDGSFSTPFLFICVSSHLFLSFRGFSLDL